MSEQTPLAEAIAKVEVAFAKAAQERRELDLARDRRASAFYLSLFSTMITAVFYVLVADHPENTTLSVAFGLLLATFIFMWGRVFYLGSVYYKIRNSEKTCSAEVGKAIASLAVWKSAF